MYLTNKPKNMPTSDRSYQNKHIDSIVDKVLLNRKVLAQLPTGGGKTHEFVLIAQRYIRSTGKSVLVLVHRKELMAQAAKRFKKVMDLDPCLITSKTTQFRVARVYIGMIESTVKRLDCFDNVGMVIIDECHMANFNKVHSIFFEELIIGFTATPISSSKKEPLNKFYNTIVAGPNIKELINLGFLAQNITRCPKEVVDSTQFEIDNRKGDFNENLMAIEYKKPKYVTNVIKAYSRYCKNKKTIVFNVNIEHSKTVTECFEMCGYNARHIDSEDDTNRDATLKWFKETPNAILCNVGIATTGFDEATIERVITNFSTLSLNKAIQCWGRGSRFIDERFIKEYQSEYPYPLQIKEYFEIIDMGGNCVRFGDWCDDRDWECIFNNPDIPGDGVAPVKTCPACEGLVHAAINICNLPKYPIEKDENGEVVLCGNIFDKKKHAEEQELGEMITITKNIDIDYLIKKNEKKYDYYTFDELGEVMVKSMYERYRVITQDTINKAFPAYYYLCKEWWSKVMKGRETIQDISHSTWHINKAKYTFHNLIEKYKNKYEKINNKNCRVCGEETDLTCDDCDFPVCEKHQTTRNERTTCRECEKIPVHYIHETLKQYALLDK